MAVQKNITNSGAQIRSLIMFTFNFSKAASAGAPLGGSRIRLGLYLAIAASSAMLLAGCGSGSTTTTGTTAPTAGASCSSAISSATGKWVTVVNNTYVPPGVTGMNFFSYNQPSINSNGEVVFRARAKAAGGAAGGEPHRGVWAVDLCSSPALQTIVDSATLVPDPNNLGVTFTETPSIPRIDISSSLLATRGNSQPVWTYVVDPLTGTTTKAGTTGIFTWIKGPVATGVNILGNVPDFSYFQVPGAPAGTKFDVFPGSPAMSNGRYIAFKGNYTVPNPTDPTLTLSKTGVYFRDITVAKSPVILIADSNTTIPGQSVPFGSTAPPSAADGKMVFTGLDIEDAPTRGGIYVAPLTDRPPLTAPDLTAIAHIGEPVPDQNGVALADGSTFAAFGEGLAYDGRYVAFWGAWGADKRPLVLTCPADGNKDIKAYCLAHSGPGGTTEMQLHVNQGIFLHDTKSGKTLMVARAGAGQAFQDFLYWVYSGRPPGTGSGDDSDGEPPRWRSSAFVAVDGARGVLFKGSRSPIAGVTVPSSGIYGVDYVNGALTDFVPVIEVGSLMEKLDPHAPVDSSVLSVGIEREAFRNGWVTMTVSTINPAGESWAGIYATHVSALKDIPPAN
jgi:hypothetical protein